MHLLRFKCKVTGRTFQEVKEDLANCDKCAFSIFNTDDEDAEAVDALYRHCLGTDCGHRGTHFVEVKE